MSYYGVSHVANMDTNSGGPGGLPGPFGLAIPYSIISNPLSIESARDLMEVTYLWPPG
jgi:hypothetical protein